MKSKTTPRINLILIMLIVTIFSVAVILVDSAVNPETVFMGAAGVIALVVTALVMAGDTDKMVPMSTHLRLMSVGRNPAPASGAEEDVNPLRINLLFGFGLLCILGILALAFTEIDAKVVMGAIFPLGIVLGKTLADPGANDKVVPEEVTMQTIQDMEDRHFRSGSG